MEVNEQSKIKLRDLLDKIKTEEVYPSDVSEHLKELGSMVYALAEKLSEQEPTDIAPILDKLDELKTQPLDIEPIVSRLENIIDGLVYLDHAPIVEELKSVKDHIKAFAPKEKDYTKHHEKTHNLLQELILAVKSLSPSVSKGQLDELKDEVDEKIKNVKKNFRAGASMPRDWREDTSRDSSLSGTIDDINKIYTLKYTPRPNTLHLYLNGAYQTQTTDFTISANTITFNYPPPSGSLITAKYSI